MHKTYVDELKEHVTTVDNRLTFKGNHIILKGQRNMENLKNTFVDKLIEKLNERFPAEDSNILYAFGTLGCRPLSFLSKEELEDWGNEKIGVLVEHFGKRSYMSLNQEAKADPIIEPDATKRE